MDPKDVLFYPLCQCHAMRYWRVMMKSIWPNMFLSRILFISTAPKCRCHMQGIEPIEIFGLNLHDSLTQGGWFMITDSKVHGTNMGPTWVLSVPDWPHVGSMNLAIRDGRQCLLGMKQQFLRYSMHVFSAGNQTPCHKKLPMSAPVVCVLARVYQHVFQLHGRRFSSGLLHYHHGNHIVAPMSMKLPRKT